MKTLLLKSFETGKSGLILAILAIAFFIWLFRELNKKK